MQSLFVRYFKVDIGKIVTIQAIGWIVRCTVANQEQITYLVVMVWCSIKNGYIILIQRGPGCLESVVDLVGNGEPTASLGRFSETGSSS
jgi:hypothetical protein